MMMNIESDVWGVMPSSLTGVSKEHTASVSSKEPEIPED